MDRYEEALERAKKGLPIDEVFPELKESEEDERIRKALIGHLKTGVDFVSNGVTKAECIAWLEKKKEQKPESCDCSRDEESYTNGIHHVLMNPEAYGLIKQQPAEWSEEDERKRQACISTINEVIDYERERWEDYNPGKPYRPIMKYDEQIDWLKSLRPQPKVEWSEEDNNALVLFHELISFGYTERFCDAQTAEDMRRWLNERLKSLRPQPRWKPSEEQIEALENSTALEALAKAKGLTRYEISDGVFIYAKNEAEAVKLAKKRGLL